MYKNLVVRGRGYRFPRIGDAHTIASFDHTRRQIAETAQDVAHPGKRVSQGDAEQGCPVAFVIKVSMGSVGFATPLATTADKRR
jgi:hypothetical protein